MDTWGIVIFIVGLALYFITKKQAFWLFVSGIGAGIVVGAVWAVYLVNQTLDRFAP